MTEKKDNNYEWWKKSGLIYQIYPRSYKDTTQNGTGDLQGIIQKLDYVRDLGVDAIWFSPFFKSPQVDMGYDVSDYKAIDPLFGSMADFDELVTEMHDRDLKIILDLVPNHSSIKHPWFQESKKNRNNPKANWYVWKDPAPDGGPPNNWISITTAKSAWTYSEERNQYYLHSFHPAQPDLNWFNPEVREAMMDVIRFWIEKGVDGFRIDMISWLGKDPQFRDNPTRDNPLEEYAFNKQDPKYSKDYPTLWEHLKVFRKVINEYPNKETVLIGELDYYLEIEEILNYYTQDETELIDIPSNFKLLFLPFEATTIKKFADEYLGKLAENGRWPNWVMGNHDRKRLRTRYGGKKQARLAAILLLTLKGTVFIYYGDEIGMPDVDVPLERAKDPWAHLEKGKGRDGCRTPMQWSNEQYAGFSTVEPWLPISEDYKGINVAVEQQQPNSMLSLYKKLIEIRKQYNALTLGSYESLNDVCENCFVYKRKKGQETFIVILNFSNSMQEVIISELDEYQIILSSYLDNRTKISGNTIKIRSYEGCLLKNRR